MSGNLVTAKVSPGDYVEIVQYPTTQQTPDAKVDNHYRLEYGEYTHFEIDKLAERGTELTTVHTALNFQLATASRFNVWIELNSIQLYDCLGLYINDIKEHSSLHNSRGPSKYRRAAFLSRHISNIRPVRVMSRNAAGQVVEQIPEGLSADLDEAFNHANELFAVRVFCYLIGFRVEEFNQPKYKEILKILVFVYKFRDPQKELLAALGRALSINQETPPLASPGPMTSPDKP